MNGMSFKSHLSMYIKSGLPTQLESREYGSRLNDGSKKHLATEHNELGSSCSAPVALWRSVIYQALVDATWTDPRPDLPLQGERGKQSKIADAARSWLRANQPDFFSVCSLANLDPGWVKRVRDAWYKRGGPPPGTRRPFVIPNKTQDREA